ncbi:MAG: alcohol dehydrogenase catalytic domain-containing protein, partial [Bacteroidota bacterium]
MKYIVCEKPGQFILKEKEMPQRKAGEAILKIKQVGICGTDLHAYGGNQAFFTYPRILGHELAAEVAEIGDNKQGLSVGDKVIIMPYVSCGKCIACRNGKPNCCTNIRVLGVHSDGGMQEYFAVPTNILIPAGNLSLSEIALVEPLAIGAHAIRRANVQRGENIVVVGCGPIGIGLMKLAQMDGARVIALDVNEDR